MVTALVKWLNSDEYKIIDFKNSCLECGYVE
jgi:hypothetical protein